uniref:Sialic acid acetylesterase n=1 Tax=Anolis carolinensis TaxID=28377 RepID=H9G3E2_ANOCA|nr:PREDICTED: sialate O-acetylesterase isoform X3 [Anolis carolinensis]|eukprot:XP_008116435.1 PREDICTED: sialate O-acetylesterase isoform X3 [Anolis carolinensis]
MVVPRLFLAPVLLLAWSAGAQFRFANYYGDHMVLQKEPSCAVLWGYGTPGANITVTVSLEQNFTMKEIAEVRADSKWKVILRPIAPGGPYRIEARQCYEQEVSNVTLNDVYFGDVWLCSGQSNMEMTVSQIFNASQELAEAKQYPLVRVFAAGLVESDAELEELGAIDLPWSVPTAENLGHGDFRYFSAVCWLFGRHLFDALQHPIGLIDSTWGGTPIEAWSSNRVLHECGLSKDTQRNLSLVPNGGPKSPSVLWNAMIHPFADMTLRGAIWYQGEENTHMNTDLYNCTFPTLIEDWRRTFHEGSMRQTQLYFPFGFVQLCTNHHIAPDDNFARIRWHQTADFGYAPNKKMPNTFMAVTIDLGDNSSPYGSIHPRDKQSVAYRLYLGALAVAYGKKSLVFQGPYPQTVEVNAQLGLIKVTYNEPIELRQLNDNIFEVCCSDQPVCKWSPVSMKVSMYYSVFLLNTVCPKTVGGLRYAWMEWPCEYMLCPLYNVQNLPAPPFITFAKDNPAWIIW